MSRIYEKLIPGNFNPDKWWKYRNRALKSKGFLKLILTYFYYRYTNSQQGFIPLSTKIEECPTFPHGISGIFISSGAKIGKGTVIFHQVTIGSNTLKDSKGYGSLTVGNNVYIGCGAKVIGGIFIGDSVRIGANCCISEDIPKNVTVVMEKNRVIRKNSENDNVFNSFKKLD